MRVVAVVSLTACAAATPVARPAPTRQVRATQVQPAVDPLTALASDDALSWLAAGPVQLELGASPLQPVTAEPIAVTVIEDRGSLVRVGIELQNARLAAWTDHARLLAIVRLDTRIDVGELAGTRAEVDLKRGAHARRLAHKDGRTQIRYLGAVEIDGWVGDAALTDRGARRDPAGRYPTGRETLMVMPGAVIRSEPHWGAPTLAVIADGYFVDRIAELEDGWFEINYEDGEVRVHGFVSQRDPPGQVHRPQAPDVTTPNVTPNATIASGTCLYASEGGEPIGYIVGDASVALEARSRGWFEVTIDSAWGPLALVARGTSETDLVACAPAGSVPAPAGKVP